MLRTAGGHRRIPREGLEEILAKGGDLSSMPNTALNARRDSQVADRSQPSKTSESCIFERQEEFRQALDSGMENRCRQLIHQLVDEGWRRSQAADAMITDAMHHIGHRWAQGDLAVYQERRACGICQGLLHELKQSILVPEKSPVAIGCAPEGDGYQLPTQMVELVLREAGWRATSLGSNVPIKSISAAVDEYRPRLLWISLSHVDTEDLFVSDFNSLAAALPGETSIILGGRAANDVLRPRLRYTAHCDSLVHLSGLAAAFLSKLS